ncbi:FAD dependent oxidoreductase [Fomitiporia mediterranea MF3/22]|uniref:FAD dependent oxidoreductase n=1 Tax=Fomitiporia mediterranea (strain MF3/22) TaxID=694068 RepID=UPI0004408A67|nr:FAD dependent oxidoreductase [Fomitiporia mediterranea MF3/22]EJD04507.1 FAD dependent oxidoreductase [Fomitiporia mediterranea MF3/22]
MGAVWSRVKVLRIAVKQVLALSASYERLQKRIQQDPGLPVPNPTHSFWHDVPSPISTHIPDSLPRYADVVIIGSGITGASVARTLFREGGSDLKVLMLEARETCSGATGRNGGHIKPPLHHDYLMLKKKFGAQQAAKLVRLRLMHVREILAVADEDDVLDDCNCREVDSLDVYFTRETFDEAKESLQAWREDMPEESTDYAWVEGKEAIEVNYESLIFLIIQFGLQSSRLWIVYLDRITGVVYNTAGAVHPYRFVTGILARLLDKHEGRFTLSTHTPCTGISVQSGLADTPLPLYRVETPRGSILTRHVVHATNAWASHLLPQMRTKIICVRGNMTAQRPGNALTPSTLDGQRSWVFYDKHIGYDYLTQLPNGEYELMFGGGFVQAGEDGLGEIGCSDDSQYNSGVAAHLSGALPVLFGGKNWGSEAAPSLNRTDEGGNEDERWFPGRMKAIWSGIIGISADRIPWVGRMPQKLSDRVLPSLIQTGDTKMDATGHSEKVRNARTAPPGEWIAAGYSGEGMAHAFLCGRAVAMQVLDRAHDAAAWLPECLAVTEARWAKARAEDLIEELWG